jgi:hypothetical protein
MKDDGIDSQRPSFPFSLFLPPSHLPTKVEAESKRESRFSEGSDGSKLSLLPERDRDGGSESRGLFKLVNTRTGFH